MIAPPRKGENVIAKKGTDKASQPKATPPAAPQTSGSRAAGGKKLTEFKDVRYRLGQQLEDKVFSGIFRLTASATEIVRIASLITLRQLPSDRRQELFDGIIDSRVDLRKALPKFWVIGKRKIPIRMDKSAEFWDSLPITMYVYTDPFSFRDVPPNMSTCKPHGGVRQSAQRMVG